MATPMKAIRAKCMDCSGDNANEVKLCPITWCPLYPYRLGKNPAIKGRKGAGDPNFGKRMSELKTRSQNRENEQI